MPRIIQRMIKGRKSHFHWEVPFREQLKSQLGLRKLTEEQEVLAEYILGNIDDDGYLRRELEAIADDLAFSSGLEASYEALHEVLMIIQEFDPAGVGARSLQECLAASD